MASPTPIHGISRPDFRDRLRGLAQSALGLTEWRPGQEEALLAVLGGRDTLAVLPTGAGKSAIYQLAGRIIPGVTVVVSPLIALQKDQAESIASHRLGGAAVLNSMLGKRAQQDVLDGLDDAAGPEFVFLAPEQLARAEVLDELRAACPSLFVVDEAHCVSEWGHNFRPDYLELAKIIDSLGHPTVLALTATASPPVRDEIVERLGLRDPAIVVRGFDRPNIHLTAELFSDRESKLARLVAFSAEHDGPGIVYCATRRRTAEVAEALSASGRRTEAYHAGLRRPERDAIQDAFAGGILPTIAATSAFGMGIDNAGVRFVAHFDIPESVDSYYQEIGRAGRDGKPAAALLLYRPEDLTLPRMFAGGRKRGEVDEAAEERRRRWDASRVEMIRGYAETRSCRREYMLTYFGEGVASCGHCDNCQATSVPGATAAAGVGLPPLQSHVRHERFGHGRVIRHDGEKLAVLFDEDGYRTLDGRHVLQEGLLRAEPPG